MNEIKCAQCGKILSRQVDKGNQLEGYYLYFENAYCSDCWDENETDVFSKSETTSSVIIKANQAIAPIGKI